jgi:hypothetical protein
MNGAAPSEMRAVRCGLANEVISVGLQPVPCEGSRHSCVVNYDDGVRRGNE